MTRILTRIMTRTRFISILALLLAVPAAVGSVAASAQGAAPRRPRIAVMDFDYAKVQSSTSALFGTNVDVGKGIADLLVTGLVKDGSYSIIERKALDKIMAEQNFSNSNRADPTSAAKLGKLLGVDAILVGSITEFGNETKKTNLGGGGGNWGGFGVGGIGHSKSNANVGIDARLINVDTGEIMAVAEGKGTSSRSSTSLLGGGGSWHGFGAGNADFGSSDFQNTIIGEATKQAVDQLTVGLVGDVGKVGVRTISVEGPGGCCRRWPDYSQRWVESRREGGRSAERDARWQGDQGSCDGGCDSPDDHGDWHGAGDGCGRCVGGLHAGGWDGLQGRRYGEDGYAVGRNAVRKRKSPQR